MSPYAGHRFPAEVISQAVWLYFRFPLSLRMVEEMMAARGIVVSHETIRQWAFKFGQEFTSRIRRRLPRAGDKWHLDEVAIKIAGVKHWLWRAVDQTGMVLDVLVQSRRDKRAAKRLLCKLLKRQCRAPRVMVTDKLPRVLSTWWASRHAPSFGSPALSFMLPPGRTSPAATLGRLRHEHVDTARRPSNVAAAGSGRRSWRGMTGSAVPALVT